MNQKTEKGGSTARIFSRFAVGVTLLIILWLLISGFLFTTRPTWGSSWHYGVAFFFWFYALGYGALYSYISGSSPSQVVWLSLGSKVVKFFLTLLLIVLYWALDGDKMTPFVVDVLVCYFLTLIYELIFIVKRST